jgi:phosphatidate cytidylyltransferase
LGITLSLLFILQAQWPNAIPLGLLLTVAVLGSLIWTLGQRSIAPATDWALTLTGSLYLGWLLGHAIRLRALDNGLLWLFLAAAGVWAADVTAYFAGRAFGRHKWWPRHSPNKTWEGYLSGVVASIAVVGVIGAWLLQAPLASSLLLGLIIGSVAPLGDLAESMIKREVGAKDSSHLIPGHGGILDRIDSLLFSIPIVFYWVSLVLR